jgi:acetyltransferase-like isoleucine patch superfamily enzyme
MRKVTPAQILTFAVLVAPAIAAAWWTTRWIVHALPFNEFRVLGWIAVGAVLVFVFVAITHRVFLRWFPLRQGEIPAHSGQEFVYHVYLLFYLIVFHPIIRSSFVPVPLLRLVYQALGARLGTNTYTSGIIYDPTFVAVGANTILGQTSLLVPHVIEGERLAHYPIVIGDNVTIGAHAVVLSDVVIGDRAIVASGAVVAKGTRIGASERWGGVPARRLSQN